MALFPITKSSGLENCCRVCTMAATCVDTYFKSQGQTIDLVIVDLGKPVQFLSFNYIQCIRYTIPWQRKRYHPPLTRFQQQPLHPEDLCKEEMDWRNLWKRQKEIITTANTGHAHSMLDSHRFSREKELGEGKGTTSANYRFRLQTPSTHPGPTGPTGPQYTRHPRHYRVLQNPQDPQAPSAPDTPGTTECYRCHRRRGYVNQQRCSCTIY
jgi:hypothetical protein